MATDPKSLTFGIELETVIPVAALQSAGWRVGAYHSGAVIPGHDGWKAMSDSTIVPSDYNDTGVEVVSPILQGLEGLDSARAMVAKLKTLGAKVNQSTGFHVHVGWTGTPTQLRRLVCLVAHHEKALYASTGTRTRERGSFCSSIKIALRQYEQAGSQRDIIRNHHARYHVLNLQNLEPYGKQTVEFRVFAGTVNIQKIETYIQLCLGLVCKALDTTTPVKWDHALSNRADRATTGEGLRRMRHLLCSLGWCANYKPGTNRVGYGLLGREAVGPKVELLKRLATKYDAAETA